MTHACHVSTSLVARKALVRAIHGKQRIKIRPACVDRVWRYRLRAYAERP